MIPRYVILLLLLAASVTRLEAQESPEAKRIRELYRLRNEHKADSAEFFFTDTVKVYMKYLRNVPRSVITKSDRAFWKAHPRNRFEITSPVQVTRQGINATAIFYGKEYLDGTSFQYEKIEIKFDGKGKIYSLRGFSSKKLP